VDVVVKRATESDIPQVVGFTRDTFTWGDYVPRVINKWVKDGTAYVALINGEVIGVVNLVLLPTGVAWLEGIRVKPTYRRRGVGTALTNYVLNLARVKGARYAMLMIAEWNNASHGLALKLGFKPILNVHGGVVKESPVHRETDRERMRKLIDEALNKTGGYFCSAVDHWVCTRADVNYVLSVTREVYIGEKGLGFDRGFSVGQPTTPVRMEMLTTEYGDFEEYFGRFIVYELALY